VLWTARYDWVRGPDEDYFLSREGDEYNAAILQFGRKAHSRAAAAAPTTSTSTPSWPTPRTCSSAAGTRSNAERPVASVGDEWRSGSIEFSLDGRAFGRRTRQCASTPIGTARATLICSWA
jgi:hypothetical protein